MAGVPARTVQAWGGWSSLSVLSRYSHLAADHSDAMMGRIGTTPQLRVVG